MVAAAITIQQATKISNGTYANPPEVYGFESVTVIPATFGGGFGTKHNTVSRRWMLVLTNGLMQPVGSPLLLL